MTEVKMKHTAVDHAFRCYWTELFKSRC